MFMCNYNGFISKIIISKKLPYLNLNSSTRFLEESKYRTKGGR